MSQFGCYVLQANERVRSTENAALGQISQLESRLSDISRERDDLRRVREQNDHELSTLRRTMSQREEESRRRLGELEQLRTKGQYRTVCYFLLHFSASFAFITHCNYSIRQTSRLSNTRRFTLTRWRLRSSYKLQLMSLSSN